MPREGIARLTPTKIHRIKAPGLHADGGNLYLNVSVGKHGTNRAWIFRIPGGKQRDLGLGSIHNVSLARARELAQEAREMIGRGVDPIDQRRVERAKAIAAVPVRRRRLSRVVGPEFLRRANIETCDDPDCEAWVGQAKAELAVLEAKAKLREARTRQTLPDNSWSTQAAKPKRKQASKTKHKPTNGKTAVSTTPTLPITA